MRYCIFPEWLCVVVFYSFHDSIVYVGPFSFPDLSHSVYRLSISLLSLLVGITLFSFFSIFLILLFIHGRLVFEWMSFGSIYLSKLVNSSF